jgi:acetoin utilization deacetylase AcuC-like enzyme
VAVSRRRFASQLFKYKEYTSMKAYISRYHDVDWPGKILFRGQLQPHHDVAGRGREIELGLRDAGITCQIAKAQAAPPELLQIHSVDYLTYLQSAWHAWRDMPNASEDVRPNISPNRYFNSQRSQTPVAQAGRYLADNASPIVHDTWQNVWSSAEAAIDAAQSILDGGQSAYALCRPSGHHAVGDMAMGGCFLANTALAAQRLISKFGKVAVLDIDMHHGNGTQQIFYQRSDVLTVSIHGDPTYFYPFYAGYEDETGQDQGESFNLNLALERGTRISTYLVALERALDRIAVFGAPVLVVATGYDTYVHDAFGMFALETPDYAVIGKRLAELKIPTVFIQEGGYFVDALRANTRSLVNGYFS